MISNLDLGRRRERVPERRVATLTACRRPHAHALFFLLTLGLAAALALVGYTASAHASPASDRTAARLLGLSSRFTFQRLLLPPNPRRTSVPVEIDGKPVTLQLEPSTLRAAGFRVLVQGADGALHEALAPTPQTVQGTVRELPGSIVGGTLHDGLMSAAIALADGRMFYVQPMSDATPDTDPSLHVVYPGDAVEAEGTCLADGHKVVVPQGEGFLAAPRWADLALDADYELYQRNGSSVDSTVHDLERIISGVNVVYERDCNIHHRISAIIVRSNAADPYTSTAAGTLLDEFGDHWNASQTGVTRDVAHLMTGKNLDGGTIGIAWIGVVCNRNSAYGLSETRFTSNFGARTALTAHELGHNWNAEHCDGAAQCNIMCSSINGCDGIGLPNFEPEGVNDIQAFAASRSCLSAPPASVGSPVAGGPVRLAAPSPSPFTLQTQLRFYLERPGLVRLGIYDVTGTRVARLADGIEGSGWHTRVWNGLDLRGNRLKPGVFYARLEAYGESRIQKLTLVR